MEYIIFFRAKVMDIQLELKWAHLWRRTVPPGRRHAPRRLIVDALTAQPFYIHGPIAQLGDSGT